MVISRYFYCSTDHSIPFEIMCIKENVSLRECHNCVTILTIFETAGQLTHTFLVKVQK